MRANGNEPVEVDREAPVGVDQEAAFWRARYLELLQNHTQIVALMAKRDAQLEQSQKLSMFSEQLKKRVEDRKRAEEQTAIAGLNKAVAKGAQRGQASAAGVDAGTTAGG